MAENVTDICQTIRAPFLPVPPLGNELPLSGEEEIVTHPQLANLLVTFDCKQRWSIWSRREGDVETFGAILSVHFPDGAVKTFSITPRFNAERRALRVLSSMVLRQGFMLVAARHGISPPSPTPSMSLYSQKRISLDAFKDAIAVPVVFTAALDQPLKFFRRVFKWSTRVVTLRTIGWAHSRFAAILNVGDPAHPIRALSWFAGPYFVSSRVATLAVSRLAFSDPKLRSILPAPIVMMASVPQNPRRVRAWIRNRDGSIVIRLPINLAAAGPRTREMYGWFKAASHWVTWMIVCNREDIIAVDKRWHSCTILLQVGIGSAIAAGLCVPGLRGERVGVTIELAGAVMRNRLIENLRFEEMGNRANLGSGLEQVPPWGSGLGGADATDCTLDEQKNFVRKTNNTWLHRDSLFNGILAGAGLEGNARMSALHAMQILVGRHMATYSLVPLKASDRPSWGCILEVAHGGFFPPETIFVPCTFPTERDATTAVCLHALYPSRLEIILSRQLSKFERMTQTPAKIAYMRNQFDFIESEAQEARAQPPTLTSQQIDGQHHATVTVYTPQPQSWVSGPQPSAEIAEAVAVWKARRGGAVEAIDARCRSYLFPDF